MLSVSSVQSGRRFVVALKLDSNGNSELLPSAGGSLIGDSIKSRSKSLCFASPRYLPEMCGNCTESGELKGQKGTRSVGQQLRHANAAETCIDRAVPARNSDDFPSTGARTSSPGPL